MFDLFQSVGFLGSKLAPPPASPETFANEGVPQAEAVGSADPRIWKSDGSPNVEMKLSPEISTAVAWMNWFKDHGYPDSGALIVLLFTDWSFKGKYPDMYWSEVPKPKFPIEREQLFLSNEELKLRFEEMRKLYQQYYARLLEVQETGAEVTDVTIPTPDDVPGVPVIQAGFFDQVTGYLKSPYVLGGLAILGFFFLRKKL